MARFDRLVLGLLWREFRNSVRSLRRSDLLWIAIGGGLLIAYGIADLAAGLSHSADRLRGLDALWLFGLPALALAFGASAGRGLGRLAASRAFAPYLRPLPLSDAARRRSAGIAAAMLGMPLALAAGLAFGTACAVVGRPAPALSGAVAAALFAAAFAAMALPRIRRVPQGEWASDKTEVFRRRTIALPLLPALDRSAPRWLGAWAWQMPAGRLVLSLRPIAGIALLVVTAALAMAASFAQKLAIPAVAAAVLGGLAVFMLTLRSDPLMSPVLRTAPVRFLTAWTRLLRLPLLLSLVFFAAPASAAALAEPAAWEMPLGGSLVLLALNACYAAFSAYFATAPLLARFGFTWAVGYTLYHYPEYGRILLVPPGLLAAWLWVRARRRYYDG